MKWLHFSDIHRVSDRIQGVSALILDSLKTYLSDNNITADTLFFTGDFRYAKTQKDSSNELIATEVAKTIWEIASCLGVADENRIHITAGNHDLTWNSDKVRKNYIDGLKRNYFDSLTSDKVDDAKVSDGGIIQLTGAFEFYKEVVYKVYTKYRAENIWSKFQNEAHYMDTPPNSDVGILCLNTALVSSKSSKDEIGSLLLDHSRVRTIISKHCNDAENKNKPIIALAHHPMKDLHHLEKQQIQYYFENYNVLLYLAGHTHQIWSTVTDDILLEATAGACRADETDTVGFLCGEYNPDNSSFTINNAHIWRRGGWERARFFRGSGNRIKFRRGLSKRSKSNLASSIVSETITFPLSRIDNQISDTSPFRSKNDLIVYLQNKPREKAIKFLISGPSEANNLEGHLDSKFFYDNFYIEDNFYNERKLVELLSKLFNDPDYNMLLLLGDAGTGKSTFIRTMALKASDKLPTNALNYSYIFLDCAEKASLLETANYIFPFMALLKRMKKEYGYMFFSEKNGGKHWKEIYIRLLKVIDEHRNYFDNHGMSGLGDAAQSIHRLLTADKYRSSYHTEEFFYKYFGTPVNMILYCLLLVSKNVLFAPSAQRKYVIIYDNVEAYTNAEHLNVGRIFRSVNEVLFTFFKTMERSGICPKELEPFDFMKDFTFVISARPTTINSDELLNSNHNEKELFGPDSKYVYKREYYPFTIDALLRKLRFLNDYCLSSGLFTECKQIAGLLVPQDTIERYLRGGELNDDPELKQYIEEKYMPFFNNNYRNAISSFDKLYDKEMNGGSTWMSEVLELSSKNEGDLDKIRINAARQIILRNSLDEFNRKGYLEQMGIGNITGKQSYSLARMLMSFVRSCELKEGELTSDGTHKVTIQRIVDFLTPFFPVDYILAEIFRLSKWSYSKKLEGRIDKIKRTEMITKWAYFLEIECSQADYEKILSTSSHSNELYDVFVSLTPAGDCFTRYVSLQFEYLATRFDEHPLPPLSLCVLSEDLLEKSVVQVENVHKAVQNFVYGIVNPSEIESIQCREKQKKHLSIRSKEVVSMITEHIDYVDRCRRLMLTKRYTESKKKNINDKMVSIIIDYFYLMNNGLNKLLKFSPHDKLHYHGWSIPISIETIESVSSEFKGNLNPRESIFDFFIRNGIKG